MRWLIFSSLDPTRQLENTREGKGTTNPRALSMSEKNTSTSLCVASMGSIPFLTQSRLNLGKLIHFVKPFFLLHSRKFAASPRPLRLHSRTDPPFDLGEPPVPNLETNPNSLNDRKCQQKSTQSPPRRLRTPHGRPRSFWALFSPPCWLW